MPPPNVAMRDARINLRQFSILAESRSICPSRLTISSCGSPSPLWGCKVQRSQRITARLDTLFRLNDDKHMEALRARFRSSRRRRKPSSSCCLPTRTRDRGWAAARRKSARIATRKPWNGRLRRLSFRRRRTSLFTARFLVLYLRQDELFERFEFSISQFEIEYRHLLNTFGIPHTGFRI